MSAPSAESPALVGEVERRLLDGWTFMVDGRTLSGSKDDATIAIVCSSHEDAGALLEAAQA